MIIGTQVTVIDDDEYNGRTGVVIGQELDDEDLDDSDVKYIMR